MATIFKEVVTVNAPDQDVVFDGCDFAKNGYIEITAAKSVKVVNSRFYSDSGDGISVSGETKLMVSHCYFKEGSTVAIDGALDNDSYVSSNYFAGGNKSIVIHEGKADTTFTVSNNVFKGSNHIDLSVPGALDMNLKLAGNTFEADYLMGIRCNAETESYNDVKIQFENNIGKNCVILDVPMLGGAPIWSDTNNYPKVTIDGKPQGYSLPISDDAEMEYNLMFLVIDSQNNQIGAYASFAEAYQNSPKEASYYLLADAEINETVTIDADRAIQFDLNGYTLTLNQAGPRCIFNNGDLIIFNGTINQVNENAYGCIDNSKHNAASLTLQEVVVNDAGNGDGAAIVDRGNGDVLLSHCEVNCTNGGKAGNACCTLNNGAHVILENSEFECMSGSDGKSGSYPIICRGAELHVDNCNVHGAKGGIGMDYGKVYINGGSFTGDFFYGCWVTNDGVSTECHITGNSTIIGNLYAVYCSVDDGNQDVGDARVTIDSGTFIGNKKAAAAIGSKSTEQSWGMEITGGKFIMADGTKSDVSLYVKDGYVQNDAGEVIKTV